MTFRAVIAVFSILCVAVATNAQGVAEKLRAELLAMRDRDQRARDDCSEGSADERLKCYVSMAETIDKPNTKRLKEI
jgi:hypothetical protein